MGRALAASSPAAAAVFAAADAALGEPITRLAWEGPEEDLNRTENAQPALLAASIAYLAAVRDALGRSSASTPRAGLRGRPLDGPVLGPRRRRRPRPRRRGPAGPRARPADAGVGRRARGRDGRPHRPRRRPAPGARRAGRPPTACSASPTGTRRARSSCPASAPRSRPSLAIAKELGAKRAIELPVSVAAHSPLMAEAAAGMARVLADDRLPRPRPPLLANADARHHDRRRLPRRARRPPHRPASTGSARSRRCRAHGVDHVHRDRPRPGPDRPHQAHRPRCRRHRDRRQGGLRPARRPFADAAAVDG